MNDTPPINTLTPAQNAEVAVAVPTETTELKIGGCTYIVTSKYKESGETLKDKLWRLIENDRGDYYVE